MSKGTLSASIVIPNYNGEELLRKSLPLVIKAKENSNNKIKEIIVVDDASIDKSIEVLKKEFPAVSVVKHKINRGFAASVNTGARSSRGDLVVLLNSDVFPDDDFLVPTFKHFKNDSVFAVSLHEKGYGWAKGRFADGFIVHEAGRESKRVHESFWASGGSAVIRRSLWMKLGGMDEKLFKFYWEDVDLSYRAQKRGFKVLWEPKAKVVHKHESVVSLRFSKGQLQRMQETNQLTFIWKNLTSPNLFRKHIRGLMRRVSRNPGYVRIVFNVIFKLRTILKARAKEKKESKVSDEAIFAKFK